MTATDGMADVIRNLITNVIKYCSRGHGLSDRPDLSILYLDSYSGSGENTQYNSLSAIAFRDKGAGIPPEIAAKIGKEPVHGDASQPGTGRGLYETYQLIKELGGHIWFETTPDEGTTFFIHLPQFKTDPPKPDVGELLQRDIESLRSDVPSLVGEIEGLTAGMENDYLQGMRVIPYSMDGKEGFVRLRLGSDRPIETDRATADIYREWVQRVSFPDEEPVTAESQEILALSEFLGVKGVGFELEIQLTRTQALYLLEALKMVPDDIYRSGYFRKLRIVEGDLNLEMYLQGVITISSQAFTGARRDLLGALLHGIGHTLGDRWGMTPHEDSLPADSRIPRMETLKLTGAFNMIRNNAIESVYVLNWPCEPGLRKCYLAYEIREFIADTFLILLVDREGLLRHVRSISNYAIQLFYQRIVDMLRSRLDT